MVAAHKKYWMPEDSVYVPVHVGAEGKQSIGYTPDNTGDNISAKNPFYCELTAIYWGWKNIKADYVGLVHYRRYFTKKERTNVSNRKEEVLSYEDWKALFERVPVVVPGKRKYYIESNESHYRHAHHEEALDLMKKIIADDYPDYVPAMNIVLKRSWAHMFNMFVMRKDLYDAYCTWMFDILFKIESKIDLTGYTTYESRVYGFVSELMLDIWLEKNQVPYAEQNVSFLEKQNWVKKAGRFLARKCGIKCEQ